MFTRVVCVVALLGLVAAPARSAEPKTKTPTVLVRVHSLNRLLDDVRYVLRLTDQPDALKQFDDGLKQGFPNGLEGIDATKPWAAYGVLEPNLMETAGVLLIPVANEKAVLGLLEKLPGVSPKKDGDYYVIQHERLPVPIYFKFAEGYLWATVRDKSGIEKDKALPLAAIFSKSEPASVHFELHIDTIPDAFKQLAIGQAELRLSNVEDKKPAGETPAQHALKVAVVREVSKVMSSVLTDGGTIAADMDISSQRDQLGFKLSVAGKPGSKLADSIKSLGQGTSQFAALAAKKGAVTANAHIELPASLVKPLADAIDAELAKGMANTKDQKERSRNEKIAKAVAPTLKAGVLDFAASLSSPSASGVYTLVAGLRVKEGAKLATAAKELIKENLPPGQNIIKITDKGAGALFVLYPPELDEVYRATFSDNPVVFDVRADAVFLGLGEKVREAIEAASAAGSGSAPTLAIGVEAAKLPAVMTWKEKAAQATELAKKYFQKSGDDQLRFGIKGGQAIEIQATLKGPAAKFFAAMGQAGSAPAKKEKK